MLKNKYLEFDLKKRKSAKESLLVFVFFVAIFLNNKASKYK